MALTARVALKGDDSLGPEDYFSASLGVIFPDDVTCQHGDAEHSLIYTSPHLPKPLHIELADPTDETDRRLFSHHLWNASLLLAELVERDSLGVGVVADADAHVDGVDAGATLAQKGPTFDIKGKSVLELGAGTALPSIMAGLLGASRVVVTDYPAPAILHTLEQNITRNIQADLSPSSSHTTSPSCIAVHGHSWGDVSSSFCQTNRHSFDRVFAADCLWMPWQHENLHRSIDHFLRRDDPKARCWVVASFHTGRHNMKGFFQEEALAKYNLVVDSIWERDCDGKERAWSWDLEEDVSMRKRWQVICLLKRTTGVEAGM
ncbi:hypothetical protein E4U43_004613 [Claviceps pusilla]|uniref:Uncharacterized protein n=1 Tax=Claviceps pusilla TaxID=123648 RepID=A0A9P7STV0_9HYPO|nr:hypothetical protein E4U43_004613 [Claviceps pusilla]